MENQRIDAVSMAIHNVLVVDPNILNAEEFVWGPGEKIYANKGQEVRQLIIDANQAPGMNETQLMLGYIDQMMGMTPYATATSSPFGGASTNTATGVQAAEAGSDNRLEVKRIMFLDSTARLAKLIVQMSHQFLSYTQLHQIIGPEGAEILGDVSPEDIPMFLDVIPKGMDEAMKTQARRQEYIELIRNVSGLNGFMFPDGTTFSAKPVISSLLEAFNQDPSMSFPQAPPPQLPPAPNGPPPTSLNLQGGLMGGDLPHLITQPQQP